MNASSMLGSGTYPKPAPLEHGVAGADPMALAAYLQALAASSLEPAVAGLVTHVMVPPGYKREDITDAVEKAQPVPNRARGTTVVHDIDSFNRFVTLQTTEASGVGRLLIYADVDKGKITAVFNDSVGPVVGWRDHRCEYNALYTPEFSRWLTGNGKEMPQAQFAEFIEDNLADLHPENGEQLMLVAQTISAKTGINFSSSRRLDNGQVQLTYNEVIEASAGTSGNVQIPREFKLGLRVFRNGPGYVINARLKYRLNSGSVKFWYELDRVERVIEDAFKDHVDRVTDNGHKVLLGAA